MTLYLGLIDEPAEPIEPSGEKLTELLELEFTPSTGPDGWHAVHEIGRYRTMIEPVHAGWRVSKTYDGGSEPQIQLWEYRESVEEAADLAMESALSAETHVILGALLARDMKRSAA